MSANVIDLCDSSSDEEEAAGAASAMTQMASSSSSRQQSSSTKANAGNQLKRWCFTLYPDRYESRRRAREDIAKMGEAATYLIAGKETCPTTKKRHYQGFVIFIDRVRLTKLKKEYDTSIHWEATKGTAKQNYEYCTKEDKEPIEYGEFPEAENAGEREKKRWKNARDCAEAGDLKDVDDDIYIRNYSSLTKIVGSFKRTDTWLAEPKNYWLWGVSGSGKSHKARTHWVDEFGPPYLKSLNKWWCNYEKERCVVIEDIDPSNDHLVGNMKRWCDKYPFSAEYKGGSFGSIRPEIIIVTSNFPIEAIFTRAEDLDAVKRRFIVEHFPFRYGESAPPVSAPEPGFVTPTANVPTRTPRTLQLVTPTQREVSSDEEDEEEKDL